MGSGMGSGECGMENVEWRMWNGECRMGSGMGSGDVERTEKPCMHTLPSTREGSCKWCGCALTACVKGFPRSQTYGISCPLPLPGLHVVTN